MPTDTAAVLEALPGARLVWVETPANPRLGVCDVAAVGDAAHAAGALLAVDNTLATPLGQRPLDLCADLAVVSATKTLSGHWIQQSVHFTHLSKSITGRMVRVVNFLKYGLRSGT